MNELNIYVHMSIIYYRVISISTYHVCRLSGAIIDYNRLLYVASELISATCERDGAATGRVQATRSTQSSQ